MMLLRNPLPLALALVVLSLVALLAVSDVTGTV